MPDRSSDPASEISFLAGELITAGTRRIHTLAWRDLDDDDAGGSEVHADEFMRRFAAAGLDVLHRTSAAPGLPAEAERHGYRVVRRGSRYSVFPRAVVSELTRRMGPFDALVEIWNGVPWFSPLWCRAPHVTMLHHVHGPMWDQILPRPLAGFGRALEARIAPPWYRRTPTVTPSAATRDELLALGFRPELVVAVDNGIDPFWSPGGDRAPVPTIVACGRLAPVKRFGLLLEAFAEVRAVHPDAVLEVVGDGPQRAELEARAATLGGDAVRFHGRLTRDDLRDAYRRAWVVSSASLAEGWGLTLTEASACGTPAVASDISGHRCSVVDGVTGVLAEPGDLGAALVALLADRELRERMAAAGLARSATLTWDASAAGLLRVLTGAVRARRRYR